MSICINHTPCDKLSNSKATNHKSSLPSWFNIFCPATETGFECIAKNKTQHNIHLNKITWIFVFACVFQIVLLYLLFIYLFRPNNNRILFEYNCAMHREMNIIDMVEFIFLFVYFFHKLADDENLFKLMFCVSHRISCYVWVLFCVCSLSLCALISSRQPFRSNGGDSILGRFGCSNKFNKIPSTVGLAT